MTKISHSMRIYRISAYLRPHRTGLWRPARDPLPTARAALAERTARAGYTPRAGGGSWRPSLTTPAGRYARFTPPYVGRTSQICCALLYSYVAVQHTLRHITQLIPWG